MSCTVNKLYILFTARFSLKCLALICRVYSILCLSDKVEISLPLWFESTRLVNFADITVIKYHNNQTYTIFTRKFAICFILVWKRFLKYGFTWCFIFYLQSPEQFLKHCPIYINRFMIGRFFVFSVLLNFRLLVILKMSIITLESIIKSITIVTSLLFNKRK